MVNIHAIPFSTLWRDAKPDAYDAIFSVRGEGETRDLIHETRVLLPVARSQMREI